MSNTTETPAGSKIMFTIIKNKTCPPDRRVGFYTLRWNGVDVLADLIEVAILCGVIEKSGSWFVLPNEEKLQGQSKVWEYLNEHQDILKQVEDAVNEKIQ